MSYRPAQQTEEDERDALIIELGVLSGKILKLTGAMPPALSALPKYSDGRIDFRHISNARLAEVCEAVRDDLLGEESTNCDEPTGRTNPG